MQRISLFKPLFLCCFQDKLKWGLPETRCCVHSAVSELVVARYTLIATCVRAVCARVCARARARATCVRATCVLRLLKGFPRLLFSLVSFFYFLYIIFHISNLPIIRYDMRDHLLSFTGFGHSLAKKGQSGPAL